MYLPQVNVNSRNLIVDVHVLVRILDLNNDQYHYKHPHPYLDSSNSGKPMTFLGQNGDHGHNIHGVVADVNSSVEILV